MDREELKRLEELADDISMAMPPQEPKTIPILKVIGVGGGGSNAVTHMYNQGIKDVSFVILNTDKQALLSSPVPDKVQIGPGLGAGNIPEVGRQYAEEDAEKIEELFDDNTKMVFITAGMGGGTGTGAGPVVARLAKERGILTVGIVTIPFLFEGKKKIVKALDGADEMSNYVDALLIINNERITEIYSDYDFINAFSKADDTLSTAASSISEIITCDGYINLDFNDVNTTLRDGGTAIISTGYGEGEGRVGKAIDDALRSPLLRNRNIFGSKHLLFNLYFSRKSEQPFKMSEATEITNFVNTLDSEVDVIWGIAFDDTLGDQVKMTILASGFDNDYRVEEVNIERDHAMAPNQGASTKTADATTGKLHVNPNRMAKPGETSIFDLPNDTPATNVEVKQPHRIADENERRIRDEYGNRRIEDIKSTADRTRYVVLSPSQMDDVEVIDRLEHAPAYNRDRRISEDIKNKNSGVGYVSDSRAEDLDTSSTVIKF